REAGRAQPQRLDVCGVHFHGLVDREQSSEMLIHSPSRSKTEDEVMKKSKGMSGHYVGLLVAIIALIIGNTPALRTTRAQVLASSWSYTGNLNIARTGHTATLLPGGKILVAGGGRIDNARAEIFNSAELYDPATGVWSLTGNLNTPRWHHTATLLPSGKVLVAGGYTPSSSTLTNTAELYDPATGAWSQTGNMNKPRAEHSATLLRSGEGLTVAG